GIVRGAGALEGGQHARIEGSAALARKQPDAAAAYRGNVENAIAIEVANRDEVGVGVGAGLIKDRGLESAIAIAQGDANTPSPPPVSFWVPARTRSALWSPFRSAAAKVSGDIPGCETGPGRNVPFPVAEQHRRLAVAVKPNYVRYSIAIGISNRQPSIAVVRVIAPCVKGRLGGLCCGEDIGARQEKRKRKRSFFS